MVSRRAEQQAGTCGARYRAAEGFVVRRSSPAPRGTRVVPRAMPVPCVGRAFSYKGECGNERAVFRRVGGSDGFRRSRVRAAHRSPHHFAMRPMRTLARTSSPASQLSFGSAAPGSDTQAVLPKGTAGSGMHGRARADGALDDPKSSTHGAGNVPSEGAFRRPAVTGRMGSDAALDRPARSNPSRRLPPASGERTPTCD